MNTLFYAPFSPYARKCRALIIEKKLDAFVTLVPIETKDNATELLAVNPLGTVPALATENGLHLCESPVICDYLDSLPSTVPRLIPEGEARLCVLALCALADGLMDAAVLYVQENRRPEEKRYAPVVERKEAALLRTLAKIEAANLDVSLPLTLAMLSTAIALEYIDFRLPHLQWRKTHPKLVTWLAQMGERESLRQTRPVA